ncbi:MAG: hypothetical protein LBC74_16120 [Planctomycetaceae bacterium]|nr:hypothetical protein [Planctomycetaceae bacterium]
MFLHLKKQICNRKQKHLQLWTKILIVDMAGVHEIYRFGAIFVLAIFMALAAWAYQRFTPESK